MQLFHPSQVLTSVTSGESWKLVGSLSLSFSGISSWLQQIIISLQKLLPLHNLFKLVQGYNLFEAPFIISLTGHDGTCTQDRSCRRRESAVGTTRTPSSKAYQRREASLVLVMIILFNQMRFENCIYLIFTPSPAVASETGETSCVQTWSWASFLQISFCCFFFCLLISVL